MRNWCDTEEGRMKRNGDGSHAFKNWQRFEHVLRPNTDTEAQIIRIGCLRPQVNSQYTEMRCNQFLNNFRTVFSCFRLIVALHMHMHMHIYCVRHNAQSSIHPAEMLNQCNEEMRYDAIRSD